MAAAGWICLLVAVSLGFAVTHDLDHSGETETYYVSAGHLFILRCLKAAAHSNVTWSRSHNLSLPAGAEVRDGLLWFLPVQVSHNGSYTCEESGEAGLMPMTLRVSVSTGECPSPSETVPVTEGVNGGLPCKQTEVFTLTDKKQIRWMKECRPVQGLSVDDRGLLRLSAVSDRDSGKYTCLVDVTVDGRTFTAARSMELTVTDDTVAIDPQVVSPIDEVTVVQVGEPVELKCLALIGVSHDSHTVVFWLVNGTYAEDFEGITESVKYFHERGRVYALSTLTISEVRPRLLNVPITCNVESSLANSSGSVELQEAQHVSLALCLSASLALVTLGVALLVFRVDLVLAYRNVLVYFTAQPAADGKLYDAFVSVLHPHPDALRSAETASFALQVLPEELERKHGYSLYIRGRDDCPGEAVHDAVAATVRQCRRLIIVLSPDAGKTDKVSPTSDNQIQLCYEQRVGLHDALTQNEPKVILLEIDGPVDYSRLPESLCYIRRRQGALKWTTDCVETHKLIRLCTNRNFWKHLRCLMPSVPARRRPTII